MKKFFLTFLLSCLSFCSIAKETLHLVTAIIPPYQKYSKDKKLVGTGVDVLKCVTKRMDMEARIEVYSWKRAQELVRQDSADGFFVASRNSTRDQYAMISAPILESKWLWVSKVGMDKKLDKESLRVGTIVGTNMAMYQTKNFKNVVLSKDMERLVTLIQKDRVDKIMCTPDMFRDISARMKLKTSDYITQVAHDRPLGVYFGHQFLRRNPDFLQRFNQAIVFCTIK